MNHQQPESPIARARRRYGRPFLCEHGAAHRHIKGPSYWTAERIAALAAQNDARRKAAGQS